MKMRQEQCFDAPGRQGHADLALADRHRLPIAFRYLGLAAIRAAIAPQMRQLGHPVPVIVVDDYAGLPANIEERRAAGMTRRMPGILVHPRKAAERSSERLPRWLWAGAAVLLLWALLLGLFIWWLLGRLQGG